MDAFFKLIAAGPLFFVSAWLLMVFAGIVGSDVGIRPFGYVTAMVVTIGLWLTLAPAIGAVGRAPGREKEGRPIRAPDYGEVRRSSPRSPTRRRRGRWRAASWPPHS